MIDLTGKYYAVFGVANKSSISWAIAQQLMTCGAYVTLACHPAMVKRAEKLIDGYKQVLEVMSCDVTEEGAVESYFSNQITRIGARLDGVVHGIAFSDTNELNGEFIATSRENFEKTMLISCFSLVEIARHSTKLMTDGGSIITLTFDAANGPYPHYNVMAVAKAALEAAVRGLAFDLGANNIRVNAISASPINTLSARGISEFRLIRDYAASMSPMGRCATAQEVANEAAYLLSPDSSGVTGQVRFVDAGSSVPNMPPVRNAAQLADNMTAIEAVRLKREEDVE